MALHGHGPFSPKIGGITVHKKGLGHIASGLLGTLEKQRVILEIHAGGFRIYGGQWRQEVR